MRILQVIDSLKVGGAQKLLAEFAREISTREHVIDVIVLSSSEIDSPIFKELQDLGIKTKWLPYKNIVDFRAAGQLREIMKAIKPDIVHTQLNYANIHGVLAARQVNIPAVSSLHNASVHLYSYRPYRTWLETRVLRRWAGRIVACGYTVAKVQQHRFPNKTLDVIPNPVPDQPGVLKNQIQSIRQQYLHDEKDYLVVSVGRLIPEKGYSDLINALRIVVDKFGKNVKLLIVGKGYLLEDLQKQVNEMEMADSIQLLGERDDVPILLAASDIYASASHYEGQSLAVLEAMASGLPVVATDVGDNRRVIAENCGSVIPAGNLEIMAREIMRLIENPQERKRIGKKANAYVRENYSVSKWTDRLLALYTEVLNG